MNTRPMSKEAKIADAANEAVFHFQMPTQQAIKFITKNVAHTSRKEAAAAINATVVEYKV